MRQYKDILYTLTRSRRKTASIYVERDGSVSVQVPEKLTDPQVDRIIEIKRPQIYKAIAEWDELNAKRYTREFVNGEGFPYLGRSYRLKLVERQQYPLALKGGFFCLKSKTTPASQAKARASFKAFYRKRGLIWIRRRVAHFGKRMGVSVRTVRVMELRHRWASCTQSGAVNFNWRTMMAPPTIIDYIVVHELAHLLHANHSAAFWNEVDKVMPDYRDRREWLRRNGAGLGL
jgi:predicted metal-dependent hydrolase